jgi:hypothetical protein
VSQPIASGGCLCGAVRFTVWGPLRDVLICHCVECRRWHGGPAACTACRREHLRLDEQRGLRWTTGPASDAAARRGFCGECGSSLFWDAPGRPTITLSAGSIDGPTGLTMAGHWFTSQKGDWYDLPDDGLPRHELSAAAEGVQP